MEAKLIKKSENYYELYEVRTNLTLLIGSTDSEKKIDVYGKDAHKLLSLKNCQAIENGYDLDELAEEGVKFHEQDEIHRPNSENLYKKGFQKALSILGDKKFSEEDMRNAWDAALNQYLMFHEIPATAWREQHIQSLQQNEWDVEICCHIDDHGTGNGSEDSFSHPMFTNTGIPKLDADGCLILKRK